MEGTRLGNLSWKSSTLGAVEAEIREQHIKRMVERSRGAEMRSERGFGKYRRAKNEVLQGQSAYRDGWYYDTASWAAAAAFTKTLFFQVPQGSAGKLLNSTNLTGQGGQVPAGETLQCNSIRFIIANSAVPADFANIVANCSVQFLVRNTPIWQWTPEWFPAGCGAVSMSAAQFGTAPAGTATFQSMTNGMPVQTAAYEFKYPYMMESQLNFNVQVNPEVAFNLTAAAGVNPLGVGVSIRIYMEGFKQGVVTA